MKSSSNAIVLDKSLLWLMAVAAGLVVANLYYNQPLLGLIASEFKVSETQVGSIAMLTQIGYAVGLLVLVPLGDKLERKNLVLVNSIGAMLMLVLMGLTSWFYSLYVISFLIGCLSITPQLFIPMVAEFSSEEKRTQNFGFVMSGLLIGILLSRMLSGVVGENLGWRSMYFIAAFLMLLIILFLYFKLPKSKPSFEGNYFSLLQSVFHFAKTEPLLQLASFRAAMGFASVTAIFTTLVFHLEQPPFYANAMVAGSFGLVGAVGAMAAVFVGRLTTFLSRNQIITGAISILLLSWVFSYFAGNTYWGLILGFVLIDFGLQSMHVMNQTDYFSINLKASSRLNTVYMVSYFSGASLGTLVGSISWEHFGWLGVCISGVIFASLSLLAHLFFKNRVKKTRLKQ